MADDVTTADAEPFVPTLADELSAAVAMAVLASRPDHATRS